MKIWFDTKSRRPASLAAGLALSLTLAACGGAGPTPPTPPDIGPARASVAASFSSAVVSISPLAQFNFRLEFDLTLRETAGLGVKVNFIRADFRDANSNFVERQEAGSIQFQRIPPNGTQNYHVVFDFNDTRASTALVTVNATDDKGNILETQITVR